MIEFGEVDGYFFYENCVIVEGNKFNSEVTLCRERIKQDKFFEGLGG